MKPSRLRQLMRVLPLAWLAPCLLAPGLLQPAEAQLARVPRQADPPATAGTAALAADPVLRVLVAEGPGLELAGVAGGLLLRDGSGLLLAEVLPGQTLQLAPDPLSPGGLRWQLSEAAMPGGAVGVSNAELWLEPAVPEARLSLAQRQYRGQMQVRRQEDGLQAINHVALEAYLPSVVGSEMPPSWPQPALRAQAVAARTYALRQRRAAEPFDLRATVSSQVYRGLESETDSTREAVAATRGLVLTYDGGLIDAVFHSSSGGSTEASGDLWPQQLPYLVPVRDFDDHSPVRSWRERFEPEQLQRLFAEIGGVLDVTGLVRTGSGRLRQLRIEGPRGVLELSGAQLRQRLGLRSTLVEITVVRPSGAEVANGVEREPPQAQPIGLPGLPPLQALPSLPPEAGAGPRPLVALEISGRGFGHGIGMSQWGAYGLALRGASYSVILSHYYPGTQLDAFRGP